MADFTSLPNEVLVMIARNLTDASNLAVLLTVNRHLFNVVAPLLYEHGVGIDDGLEAMDHGLKLGSLRVIKMCLNAGINPDICIHSDQTMDDRYRHQLPHGLQGIPYGARTELYPGLSRQLERNTCRLGRETDARPLYGYESGASVGGERKLQDHPFQEDEVVDVPDNHGRITMQKRFWKPLHVAAARGDLDLLELLLEHGADPVSRGIGFCGCDNMDNRSVSLRPLGDYDYFRPDNSSDDDDDDDDDDSPADEFAVWSPLHVAVCRRQYDCARRLIHHGGDAHMRDSTSSGAWDSGEACNLLDYNENFKVRYVLDPWSLFHATAYNEDNVDHAERVHQMLEVAGLLDPLGVDVPDRRGNTALTIASYHGHLRGLGPWLLAKGANMSSLVQSHSWVEVPMSLMSFLCRSNKFTEAALAMDLGAEIEAPDGNPSGGPYRTLLRSCVYVRSRHSRNLPSTNNLERAANSLVKKLLARGLHVDEFYRNDYLGRTPLMHAANHSTSGSLAIARTLISFKANVHEEDYQGATALQLVCASAARAVIADFGVIGHEPMHPHALMVRLLLESGADAGHLMPNGRTAVFHLFIAPQLTRDSPFQARDLILGLFRGFGADFTVCGSDGDSLLVYAFKKNDIDGVELLLSYGVIVSRKEYLQMLEYVKDKVSGWAPQLGQRESLRALRCLCEIPDKHFTKDLDSSESQNMFQPVWDDIFYGAVSNCDHQVLEALLDHGIPAGVRPHHNKDNALHVAAMNFSCSRMLPGVGGTCYMNKLVARLARVPGRSLLNEANEAYNVPLHVALDVGNHEMALALIQTGCDVHYKATGSLDTPFRRVLRMTSRDTSDMFMDVAQAMLRSPGWSHANARHELYLHELVCVLRGSAWDFNLPSSFRVARMAALAMGLLDHVDINEVNDDGNTALLLLLRLILGRISHVNESFVSISMPTPHDQVIDREEVILTLFMLFIAKGASLTIKSSDGISPLDLIRLIRQDSDGRPDSSLRMAFRQYVKLPPFDSPLSRRSVAWTGVAYEPVLLIFNDMRFPLHLISQEDLDDPRRWVCVGGDE